MTYNLISMSFGLAMERFETIWMANLERLDFLLLHIFIHESMLFLFYFSFVAGKTV